MTQNKPKNLIVIGGGHSISKGASMGLWDRIKGCFTIGCNYNYYHFPYATFYSWVDNDFYKKERENLAKLPLLIGCQHPEVEKIKLPNTITLPATSKYDPTLKTGVFKKVLVGLFALSIGCYLMRDIKDGKIFTLGFDFGEARNCNKSLRQRGQKLSPQIIKDNQNRPCTHYYQGEINHRGIGKTSFYSNKDHQKNIFQPYIDKQSVPIYNVSLNSKINQFPKITYEQFFEMLDNMIYNQDNLRNYICSKINNLKCEK